MLGNVAVLSRNGEELCEEDRFGAGRKKDLLSVTLACFLNIFSILV